MSTKVLNIVEEFAKKTQEKGLCPQISIEYAEPIVDYVGPNFDKELTTAEIQSLSTIFNNDEEIRNVISQKAKRGGKIYLLEVQDEYDLDNQYKIVSKTEIKL